MVGWVYVYLWLGLVYSVYIKLVLCSFPVIGKCHEIFLLYASEQNSESLLLFLLHRNGVAFSSAEWFGKEFREFASIFVPWYTEFRAFSSSDSFLFRGTAGIPSEQTICYIYSVFRWIIFLSEIPNPRSVVLPSIATPDRYNSRLHKGHFWRNTLLWRDEAQDFLLGIIYMYVHDVSPELQIMGCPNIYILKNLWENCDECCIWGDVGSRPIFWLWIEEDLAES
jgi:hypothetical protein